MPVARGRTQNILLAADEVNCLIYAYLLDSGFEHAAFNLRAEARLDASPHAKTHIARGTLIELLAKALLYTEVEAHWREEGMVSNCRASFSLMRKHVCAFGKESHAPPAGYIDGLVPNGVQYGNKRKASGLARNDHAGKRMRTMDPDVMDIEGEEFYGIPGFVNGSGRKGRFGQKEASGWAIEQDPAVKVLPGLNAEVFVCAWNKSEPLSLATGSKDASVRLWDLTNTPDPADFGTALVLWEPPADAGDEQRDINCIDWSPDGALLATGAMDMTLRVWNKEGTEYMNLKAHEGPIFSCRFSPSGTRILTASLDGSTRIWDVAEKNLFKDFQLHKGCALDVDWLNDDSFASCGSDGLVLVVSLFESVPIRTFLGHTGDVNQLRFNASRNLLASCSDDCKAIVWDTRAFTALGAANPRPVGFSDTPAVSEEPGAGNAAGVPVWNSTTSSVAVLRGHAQAVSHVVWAPVDLEEGEKKVLVTCSFDCTARLWDAQTGECINVIAGHLSKCYAACFSPDARFVATAAGDASLFITSVSTGQRVWEWRDARRGAVYEVAWQAAGERTLIAICLSRQVAIVDTALLPMLGPNAPTSL
ncbi:WD40 repeat-like protein [Auricularia subglabra TFB-10046 SS5]|nr:WD40 repeat-like protein [Auricularia subglabra TFB-10046 SS5]